MTEQLKAEAYVRSQRPALMELTFGCDVIVAGIKEDNPGCEYDVVVDSRKDEHGRIGLGYFGHVHPDALTIIGHPILLNDWLAVLGHVFSDAMEFYPAQEETENEEAFDLRWRNLEGVKIDFNLTTGQPATELDYKLFNDAVGI